MLEFTDNDTLEAFRHAKNLNSSVKKFLKSEGSANPGAARFAKELRDAFEAKNPSIAERFVSTKREPHSREIVALMRYAYADLISALSSQIVEKYGEEFNTTYTVDQEEITVSNESSFDAILREVFAIVDGTLKETKTPNSPLMKNTLVYTIFEPTVAEEVLRRIREHGAY